MNNILERIVADKRVEVEKHRQEVPEESLRRRLAHAPVVRDYRRALMHAPGLAIIAEVKKASPSAGVLRPDFDPVAIARVYAEDGAAAISVLTDAPFFQGHLDHLSAVRRTVSLPVLRKDFILDPYQVLEARVAGADAVLLIAEILSDLDLRGLLQAIRDQGMEPLVELYEPANLPRVLDSGAHLIGINNRNLQTFETRLEHTLDLASRVPSDICLVSESGIRTRTDMERLRDAGVKAVLIGETFMRAPDIGAKLRELQLS